MIFIEKDKLPQQLLNRLIRLAAFQNPEFYKAQAMRFSVWDKPRFISCAENCEDYIALPRGCLEAVQQLLEDNSIPITNEEKRALGERIQVSFTGTLRPEQEEALKAMLSFDTGILHAPTASGKTVIAAALISERKVSTLILVHRSELKKQWEERLKTFLSPTEGILGKKGKLSFKVDVLLFQSLVKQEDRKEVLDRYGMVIVDECHHLGAFSFELLLKQVKAKYVVGLTATPIRRDGKHPIVTMQLGPIRHVVKRSSAQEMRMVVFTKTIRMTGISDGLPIQEVFKRLALDKERNRMIAEDVKEACREGRNILVLSQRCEHLLVLSQELEMINQECFVLYGRMGIILRGRSSPTPLSASHLP
ncbi:MAG: DEAD/DEAH box helicase family protein [Sphaerochaeta sp.]